MIIMRNLLNIIIVFCVCLNSDCIEGAQQRETVEVDYYTIQLSSLFPSSSSCVPSSKASYTKSSLPVVHRHGACSGKSSMNPDHDDILIRDQARVDFIHSRLSNNLIDQIKQSQSLDLPAKQYGGPSPGTYVVTIGIGTPKHDVSLLFDTGSDLTWTQCKPCAQSCYSQTEPIFNPSSSTSYSNVSCSSPISDLLNTTSGIGKICSPSNCIYNITYADHSSSLGFLAKEKFTLTSSRIVEGVNFGCGNKNVKFTGVAGVLGLGRGELSLPSQTAKIYNKIFSYCLPSSARYTGHLTFGSAGISKSIKFTPLTSFPDPDAYGLEIVGISVGKQKLPIPSIVFSKRGAIIDSGTVVTRLPPKAYEALRDAFKDQMLKLKHKTSSPPPQTKLFDTCYDFNGFETTVKVPKISFHFGGGAVVELGSKGVLYPIEKSSLFCLAFAGNKKEKDFAIFGSVQQQTLQVVYDGAGGRVGFAPNGCS